MRRGGKGTISWGQFEVKGRSRPIHPEGEATGEPARVGALPKLPHAPNESSNGGIRAQLRGRETLSSARKALVQQENRQAEQHDRPETGPRHPDTATGGRLVHAPPSSADHGTQTYCIKLYIFTCWRPWPTVRMGLFESLFGPSWEERVGSFMRDHRLPTEKRLRHCTP